MISVMTNLLMVVSTNYYALLSNPPQYVMEVQTNIYKCTPTPDRYSEMRTLIWSGRGVTFLKDIKKED